MKVTRIEPQPTPVTYNIEGLTEQGLRVVNACLRRGEDQNFTRARYSYGSDAGVYVAGNLYNKLSSLANSAGVRVYP
jgi:hypothetical protein